MQMGLRPRARRSWLAFRRPSSRLRGVSGGAGLWVGGGGVLSSWPIQAPAATPPMPAAASMAVEWPLSFLAWAGSAGAPGAVL